MKVILTILLLVFSVGIQAGEQVTAGPIYIDVRTAEEFSAGHIDNAVNIPLDVIGEEIEKVVLNRSAEIHLYCKSGRRAGKAKTILQQLGYNNVINDGGYSDLKKKLESRKGIVN